MNKKDVPVIVLLFALMILWPIVDRQVIKKHFFADTSSPKTGAVQPESAPVEPAITAEAETIAPEAVAAKPEVREPAAEPELEPEAESVPEQTAVLENEFLRLTFSSRGASVVAAELKEYRQTLDPASAPVVLDFKPVPALAYTDLKGLSENNAFAVEVQEKDRTVVFERKTASGLKLRRTMSLADKYLVKVTDEFVNEGADKIDLPGAGLQVGTMINLPGETTTKGVVYLGVDTLSPGGEKVQHWGGKMPKFFSQAQSEKGLPKLPMTVDWPYEKPLDWVAAKNKYFAQILTPEGGVEQCVIHADRVPAPQELQDPEFKPKMTAVDHVSVRILYPEMTLASGEKNARQFQYYVGPKKYSELNRYKMHQVDVMEFGMWAPVGKVLLVTMNWIEKFLWPHNYGIAIMLLTIIIRVIFWPITHKSTESMKKMQALQPLMTEIRKKYKDNSQKQQQEIMALYKEHKVNPLGGCLPTLIQIPVFIALFVVLRSAIELRFAPFLWIKDLSAPENLFAGVLPFSINILPIFMAVTMAWQQKLTPSGGDPAQQKMMMFMPVMMLFFFYTFASGLVLYWSTNQCLMIAQLLSQKRKQAAKDRAAASAKT